MATVNSSSGRVSQTRLGYLGVTLSVITGVIHLVLGVANINGPLGPPFVLAGLGFLGGVALYLMNVRRRLLFAVGIPFTIIQFVLYFAFNWPDVISPLGLADKLVQLALVAVLVVLYRETE